MVYRSPRNPAYFERAKTRKKERTQERRSEAITLLGGTCSLCGGTADIEVMAKTFSKIIGLAKYNEAVRNPGFFVLVCKGCRSHMKRWDMFWLKMGQEAPTNDN